MSSCLRGTSAGAETPRIAEFTFCTLLSVFLASIVSAARPVVISLKASNSLKKYTYIDVGEASNGAHGRMLKGSALQYSPHSAGQTPVLTTDPLAVTLTEGSGNVHDITAYQVH